MPGTPTYFPEGNTPFPFDPVGRSLQKINGALWDLTVATLAFYPEDCAPAPQDPIQRSLVKINALVEALTIVGSVGLHGTGRPEGVVTAVVGTYYVQTDAPGTLWVKVHGSGNTGWAVNS